MRQAATAIAVYRQDIEPTLHGRQLFVRFQLEQFIAKYAQAPTGLELVRFVASRYPHQHIDVNVIRPRLFEMEQQGWVRHGAKRVCSISGKRVWTWEPATPTPPVLREPEPQSLNF